MNGLKLKDYWHHLRGLLSGHYSTAMWPVAGVSLIFLALAAIVGYFMMAIASSIMMNVVMAMYGMGSMGTVGIAILEVLVLLVLDFVIQFCYNFFFQATIFSYQDQIQHPQLTVTASRLWNQFKHVRKNQLLRIQLYQGLFIWLWTLPFDIIGIFFDRNRIAVIICDLVNVCVVIWKSIEYSQANLLYRDQQPAFLGQSMRRALTASKRYMKGLELNFLANIFVFVCLPAIIYLAIFGGLTYYGIYSATNPATFIGAFLIVVGLIFYVPYVAAAFAQYFEATKRAIKTNEVFDDLFIDTDILTGKKFVPSAADLDAAAQENTADQAGKKDNQAKNDQTKKSEQN